MRKRSFGNMQIVMFWYQNDWGLFERRNEAIAKELAGLVSVKKIIHIEPPITVGAIIKRIIHCVLRPTRINFHILKITIWRMFFFFIPQGHSKKLFIYTPISLFPRILDRNKAVEWANKIIFQIQLMFIAKLFLLSEPIVWGYPPNVYLEFALKVFRNSKLVLDYVDKVNTNAWLSQQERIIINKLYKRIEEKADLIFTNTKAYEDEFRRKGYRHAYFVPNAISKEIIELNDVAPAANDCFRIGNERIIGYLGNITADRIDVSLIEFLAKKSTDHKFVFIGGVQKHFHEKWENIIAKNKNLFYLGEMLIEDSINYLKEFDVCIIPHIVNEKIKFMDPLKIYLYLGFNKDVITTQIRMVSDLKKYIHVAHNKEEFLSKIKFLEKHRHEDRNTEKSHYILNNHLWLNRIDCIEKKMKECLFNNC